LSEPVRAFFALELSPETRDAVASAVASLRAELPEGVRWLAPENAHLTLKFLGDVPRDALPKLLARAASRLARESPLQVTLGGLGAFPNARAARVIWLGVSEGAAALARLARKLDAAGRGVGAPRDRRPFQAHLTLGRLSVPRHVPLERLVAPTPSSFRVEEVVLYESRLSSSGAVHSPLARLPLGLDESSATEFAPEL
jgi:2'-5' RNA ligase